MSLDGVRKSGLPPILFGKHHESHAASAFYPSPFKAAAVLCMDGVFAAIGLLASRFPQRGSPMVGRGGRGMSTRSRRRLSKKSVLGSQRLDDGRACSGLDQHENYSRCGLLLYRNPIGIVRRWLGKDPMGRHLRPDLASYRINRQPRPASHLTKQY